MNLLSGIWVLYKKEVKDFFFSPILYILSALFCGIIGWLFFNYLVLSKEATTATLTQAVLSPIFGNMNFIFLFMAPLLTMRCFAEEKKLNTLDLLFHSRLGNVQIILGKLFASFTAALFMLSFTLVFPVVLAISGYSDWYTVASAYLGLLLSVLCYLAVGIFASSLTENQVVSALVAFSLLLGSMLLVMSANASHNPLVGQILSYMSIPFHYEAFVRGAIKSYSLLFFLSFLGFFTFLTRESLESRNW
ncbi:MAG: hypothetical protein CME70_10720 [Halobacteriovorax sp.]|nr:hypothetical protein [Halobacteriovorax sp.]|tara:strand:- start:80468 stop:81211 length:744 start_codon:yes stop_codon:yes gene_type:complete